jgi:hypothetical protein
LGVASCLAQSTNDHERDVIRLGHYVDVGFSRERVIETGSLGDCRLPCL